MNPLLRKVNKAHNSIPLILLLLTVSGAVAAATYIIYQFSVSITVNEYPKVTFWNWSTEKKASSFTYSMNIFPNIKTIDENMTYGIFCDDSSNHICYLRINNVQTASNIAKLKIMIYNSTSTVFAKEWTVFSSLPTSWESLRVDAGKKYAIWIEITGASGANGTSAITFDLKIESP